MKGLADSRFAPDDIEYLATRRGRTGSPLFDAGFLAWLGEVSLLDGITIEAVAEGRVVHANAPMTVVTGPLAAAQILETTLLHQLNYPTLVATKQAARVAQSARGRPVLEFGLRRAPTGAGDPGARAALIGGAAFTSNVSASRTTGVEPKGTHAHSLVQAMMALGEGELGAFQAYADAYPDDCLLLVDRIDTLESGVPNAITVFERLRAAGHEPVGIRLDSGDLAYLAVRAARLLDDAGFTDAAIVLSGGLDEMSIWRSSPRSTSSRPSTAWTRDASSSGSPLGWVRASSPLRGTRRSTASTNWWRSRPMTAGVRPSRCPRPRRRFPTRAART